MSLALIYISNILIIGPYVLLILYFLSKWKNLIVSNEIIDTRKIPYISIIIIGRNEEKNIEKCINSIAANHYPVEKYEIIYIDDNSEDDSLKILNSLQLINLKYFSISEITKETDINNHKKRAIKEAINIATGEIILQTDADTTVNDRWIYSHAIQYKKHKNLKLITAPVLFEKGKNILEEFQYYDLLTTMGVTAAGISSKTFFMANGANMSYKKSAYLEFEDNSFYASGDDMFLIQNIASKYKHDILFLKNTNALVATTSEKTLKDFINQRLRWATKTKGYKDKTLQLLIIFIFLVNMFFLLNLLALPFSGDKYLQVSLIFVILKILIDSVFIVNISRFFNKHISCKYLIVSLLLYPFYLIFVGIASLFVNNYNWKGRTTR